MNKDLIRKLAIATDAWCDQNISHQVNTAGYNSCWEQKFVELIVQECAKTIRKNSGKWTEFGYEYYRPSEIAGIIEYHFGVKE